MTRGFHHPLGGNRTRKPRNQANYPDPNSPASPDYRERHTENVTELPGGFVRIDIGEPVAQVAAYPQPVPTVPPTTTASEPEASASPAPAVSQGAPSVTERDWRGDYGLAKRG